MRWHIQFSPSPRVIAVTARRSLVATTLHSVPERDSPARLRRISEEVTITGSDTDSAPHQVDSAVSSGTRNPSDSRRQLRYSASVFPHLPVSLVAMTCRKSQRRLGSALLVSRTHDGLMRPRDSARRLGWNRTLTYSEGTRPPGGAPPHCRLHPRALAEGLVSCGDQRSLGDWAVRRAAS